MSTGLNKEFRITMSHHFNHPFLSPYKGAFRVNLGAVVAMWEQDGVLPSVQSLVKGVFK